MASVWLLERYGADGEIIPATVAPFSSEAQVVATLKEYKRLYSQPFIYHEYRRVEHPGAEPQEGR